MSAIRNLWERREFARFLTVGLWNTTFAYLSFAFLYWLLHEHVHYLVIGVLAHGVSVANAYVFQRHLVFRSETAWWPAFWRFVLVQTGLLAWGSAGLLVCVELFHMHPLVSQLLLIAIATLASYALNRRFTFKVSSATKSDSKHSHEII